MATSLKITPLKMWSKSNTISSIVLANLTNPIAILIMTQELMLSLLNRAANGNEMLAVLDTLAADVADESVNQPTTESIEFWWPCDTLRTGTVCSQSRGCCAILNKSTKQSNATANLWADRLPDFTDWVPWWLGWGEWTYGHWCWTATWNPNWDAWWCLKRWTLLVTL